MDFENTVDSMKLRLHRAATMFSTIAGFSNTIRDNNVEMDEVIQLLIELRKLADGLHEMTLLYIISCTNDKGEHETFNSINTALTKTEDEIKAKMAEILRIVKASKAQE